MFILQVYKLLDDKRFQESITRASNNARNGVSKALKENPWLGELAARIKEVEDQVISNLEHYIDKTIASLQRAGAGAHLARDSRDALRIFDDLTPDVDLVVMSKSMAAEEIGLREHLEKRGVEVWETDLGQFLVQLENGKPMHTIAPAIHITRTKARRLLSRLGRDPGSEEPEKLAHAAREFLRGKILSAKTGVTGGNAIAADTGSLVLVENEGNIRLVSGVVEHHIAIVPVDKILPDLRTALDMVLVQSAYAGIFPPTYINVITGPSSTADIEHKRVLGAQGPRRLDVILLDNGRLRASKHPVLKAQLRCVRCGRCQFECPVWEKLANHWGGPVYGGPMGLNWTSIVHDPDLASELSFYCLLCGRCSQVCPVSIPLDDIIRWHRTRVWKEGHSGEN